MAWVEKDHNDHLISTPLLCAESPTTRPGCPEPHPAWIPASHHPFAASVFQVLLVSSSRHPDRWIVPGGGMEPEEEPNVAAVREVCEEAGVKGTLGRLVGIFENRDRKHRTYVYVLIVTEVLEDWEDSVNIGRKREWFKIEDAIKVLQYHKPVQASYFETLRQGCLANNGTPVMTTTYSEGSVSDIR
uniref:diphosphoinositol-polyphosphate diphosphatase n=3 Tax=Neognathae TaxID=8825 RepID=A0A8V1A5J1_CHICK